ncbi:MAG TPA: AI-2E family transporter [Gemmatimonadaceae bacterium]|jgi:predicted PurR-regulated permease PerM|nr:AI-2E family transporter [Gemmatimonadaceae bacterium]
MAEPIPVGGPDRRRLERRLTPTLAELTLPELRRMMVTTILFVIILVLFLWMVRTVIIATILGIIVAMYMRPVFLWLKRYIPNSIVASTLTLTLLIGPVLALTIYSYEEIADVAQYASAHREEIASKIDTSIRRLPFMQEANTGQAVRRYVIAASNYGTDVLSSLRQTMASIAVAATIFLFTAYYVMGDAEQIMEYIRARIPPRYGELSTALEANMRGVLYGAIYSTFLTQTIKSVIILAMNLAFHVPLPGVLAIISFIIGFFPIVGSWSVYLPVAAWLAVFRDAPGQALAMVIIGFGVNTIYISTFLRPKIAAERSKVLNFYWMLVALITGVYTFGLVGILLGPMLIGLLKAILDTITSQPGWHWTDDGGDAGRLSASEL